MNIVGLADGAIDLLLENALVNRFNMSEEQVKLYRRFDQPALRTLAQLTLDERVEELLAKKRLPERCFKALTLIGKGFYGDIFVIIKNLLRDILP